MATMEVTPIAEAPLSGDVGLPAESVLDVPSSALFPVAQGDPAGAMSLSSMSSLSGDSAPESGRGVRGLGAKRGFWSLVSGTAEGVGAGDEADSVTTTATRTRPSTKRGRRLAMRSVVINLEECCNGGEGERR